MTVRRVVAVLAVALSCVACSTRGVSPPEAPAPILRVAVLQYSDVADPVELVSSSALAVDLAIERAEARGELGAGSGLWFVETAGDDPVAIERAARALAADPAVAAAIVTPYVDAPAAERAFGEAGIPVFSFSGFGGDPGATTWRRLVPSASDEAAAVDALVGQEPCVAGRSPVPFPTEGIHLGSDPAAVTRATEERCSGIAWTGDADGGLDAVRALESAGSSVPFVVGSTARVDRFASEGYPGAVGTLAVVPCRTVSVSAEPDARRFVHGYQARNGVPPGLCAAEGYGLGLWLIERPSRAAIAAAVEAGVSISTPAGTIDLSAGEEVEPAVERVVGVRWIPVLEAP